MSDQAIAVWAIVIAVVAFFMSMKALTNSKKVGKQGLQGEQGETGETGERGEVGEQGPPGSSSRKKHQ